MPENQPVKRFPDDAILDRLTQLTPTSFDIFLSYTKSPLELLHMRKDQITARIFAIGLANPDVFGDAQETVRLKEGIDELVRRGYAGESIPTDDLRNATEKIDEIELQYSDRARREWNLIYRTAVAEMIELNRFTF